MTRSAALLLVVVLLAGQRAAIAPVVKIINSPSVLFDDEQFTVQVRVEPRPENRLLIVGVWDGSESIRTSLEQLDGETAPRHRWVKWAHLAICEECELRAYVFAEHGQSMDRRALTVRGRWQ